LKAIEDAVQLDLKLKEEAVDLGTYVLNGEWHLLGRRNPVRCLNKNWTILK